jgi:GxxExxY protein
MKRELRFSPRSELLDVNKTTESIIGAAIEVHRHLGPGLLESACEECLCEELLSRKIPFKRQVALPVTYKGRKLDIGYRIDLLVNDEVVVELKTVETILPIHQAQTLTYLPLSGKQVGLILNFNVIVLKNGIKRLVHKLKE